MELKSKFNAVRVKRKKFVNSLLIGTIMTGCISCSNVEETIEFNKIKNNSSLCTKEKLKELSYEQFNYIDNKCKIGIKTYEIKNQKAKLIVEKNNTNKIIDVELNSKYEINKIPFEICSIDKNKVMIASIKKPEITKEELLFSGIIILVILTMGIGCSRGLKD